MRHWISWSLLALLLTACGGGGGNNTAPAFGPQGSNVLSVTVGGSGLCGVNGAALDEPCVQVTLCQPGTSNCQTIPNILLDTGSVGLKIFKSVISPSISLLPTKDLKGNSITQCAQFVDFTALWGPVEVADLKLGGEPVVTVPIQVIDSTFDSAALNQTQCNSATVKLLSSPGQLSANGILGLDFFQVDPGYYYSCSTMTCSRIFGIPSAPVQNPVFLLPVDHNGISLVFPSVADTGAPSLTGALVLGIGTASNNGAAQGVSVYPADPRNGNFVTSYGTTSTSQFSGYIDSGTNGIVVPDATIPQCFIDNIVNGVLTKVPNGFLCPASTLSLTASNLASGGLFQPLSFKIANEVNLVVSSNNLVYNNLGIYASQTSPFVSFIWGFPFFIGRTVYLGYDGQSSSLGTGPFWAY